MWDHGPYAEAAERLAEFGRNVIHGERQRALLVQFLVKFRNPLVIILLIASALSAVTGDVRTVEISDDWAPRDLQLCVRSAAALPPAAAALLGHLAAKGAVLATS